jgi:hypothetical protein
VLRKPQQGKPGTTNDGVLEQACIRTAIRPKQIVTEE